MDKLRLSEFSVEIKKTKGNCVYCTKRVKYLSIIKLVYKNDWLDETTGYYLYLCDKCRMSQIDEASHIEFKTLIALLKMKPDRHVENLTAFTKIGVKEYAIVYAPGSKK